MIANLLEKKWVLLVAGLVIGLVLGLIYGWVIQPVEWVDGVPADLRADLREDYLRMVIDSYSINQDIDLAVQRYQGLGEHAKTALQAVGADPGFVSPTAIQNFRAAVEIFKPDGTTQTEAGEPAATQAGAPDDGGGISLGGILPWLCGGVAFVLVFALGIFFFRRRAKQNEDEDYDLPMADQDVAEPAFDQRLVQTLGVEEPLSTFQTVYSIGDDLYDDSFSIESPVGDFLGECGVGIADIIDSEDPKRVSSFEVWLFDKNDIQTVTKVLMSEQAFNDPAIRSRLSAKGDPVMASSGGVVDLETASLRIEARIVDMTYGNGTGIGGRYFERMAIELRAWPKTIGLG